MRRESLEHSNLPLLSWILFVVDTVNVLSSNLLVQSHEVFVPGLFTLLQKVQG